MKPLLLLVDLQRDFLAAPGLAPAAGSLVERAAALLRLCRQRGIPVAHLWTTVSRQPDNRMPHWKKENLWRCVADTPGHEPPSALAPVEGESVFHKSGFSAFAGGQLLQFMRQRSIDTLWVAGVHLHACVRQAVLDAYQEGFEVWVAEDAVGSDDPVHAAITRRYLEARSIRFLGTRGMAQALDALDQKESSRRAEPSAVTPAVECAATFAREWRKESAATRLGLLEALATRLAETRDELPERMAGDLGKPIRFGRVELQRTVELLHNLERWSQVPDPAENSSMAVVRHQPHGAVAVITPWNNPLYIALGKIAPAMLYGNTVVWKPAPEAREVSRRLQGMLAAAGWPAGLVTLVEGGRREAAQLMSEARVGAVTLTGSSAAGFAAQEICARRRIPLQAELGGNNAAIVWPDADLVEAARSVAAGAFEMAGQRCTANRRVIVQASVRERFLDLLMASGAALPWGDPLYPATRIGPLVSEAQRDRVARLVERAGATCGRALLPQGALAPDRHRFWYPPTLLCCDDPAAEIVQEETFGPVLVVQTADRWEQAIELCNGVAQGLAASIFTRSPEVVKRFLEEATAGILKVNQSTADAAVGMPFGGWKGSGVGPPEHGWCDREFYTRPQTVYGHPGSVS